MAKPVEERVKEIICEQLGVEEDEVNPNAKFIEDLGRRLARHGGAGDGVRGGVRPRDPRRGRGEDRHRRRRHHVHQREPVEGGATAWRGGASSSRGSGRSRPSAIPPRSSGRRSSRALGHRPHHPVRHHRLSDSHRRRAEGLRAAEVRRQEGRPEARPLPEVRHRVRGDGGRGRRARRRQGRRHPLRRARGLGHRRHHDAPRHPRRAQAKGPDRVSPFFIPMLIVNMASGLVSMRFGAKGPELLGGDRVRHRQPRPRRRRPAHPARGRRRDDRGRRRGDHHPAHHRRVLPDEGDVHAQRRARPRPRGRSTPTATASSAARAAGSSCWSRSSTRWRATRGSTRRSSVTA